MSKQKYVFEKIYENPGALWTRDEPPQELANLVENKIIGDYIRYATKSAVGYVNKTL